MRRLRNTGAVAAYGRSRNRVLHEAFDGFLKSIHPAGSVVFAVADNVENSLCMVRMSTIDLSKFTWTDPALIKRGPRPQQF